MSTDGATSAARACSAWARPISPPSSVTAALFDMFCGLKGRTERTGLASQRHHLIKRQIIVAQRDVELVEHDEAQGRIVQQALRDSPGTLAGGDVARLVLGFPGEPLAGGVPDHAVAERLQRGLLAGRPALDELHDADTPAVAERPQSEAEGGRRLAFAGPGVDHQQSFCDGFGCNFGVLDLLAFCHLGALTRGLVSFELAHHVLRYNPWAATGSHQDHLGNMPTLPGA